MEKEINQWIKQLKTFPNMKIGFTEFMDERIIYVAKRLLEEKLAHPVFIGHKSLLKEHLTNELLQSVDVIQTEGNIHEFSVELLRLGKIDALLSGAVYSTKKVLEPALKSLSLESEQSRVSGALVMYDEFRKYLFADCSVHLEPNAEQLAAIALESIRTAKQLNIEPKVAFLSYTTKAVRSDESYLSIKEAIEYVKDVYPNVPVDGELQFDAAFSLDIAKQKASPTDVTGDATIFIFPNLETGNIACKIIQILSSYKTFGPIVQGFSPSIQDLSRGSTKEAIYEVAIYAAYEALRKRGITE